MHKNTKNVLTKALALTLAVSMMTVSAPAADAAKKPALSAKKVTLKAGKSKKITVKNVKAKKVKKLTVKTNKKKVATVKKKICLKRCKSRYCESYRYCKSRKEKLQIECNG